jgi:hypothetical protein
VASLAEGGTYFLTSAEGNPIQPRECLILASRTLDDKSEWCKANVCPAYDSRSYSGVVFCKDIVLRIIGAWPKGAESNADSWSAQLYVFKDGFEGFDAPDFWNLIKGRTIYLDRCTLRRSLEDAMKWPGVKGFAYKDVGAPRPDRASVGAVLDAALRIGEFFKEEERYHGTQWDAWFLTQKPKQCRALVARLKEALSRFDRPAWGCTREVEATLTAAEDFCREPNSQSQESFLRALAVLGARLEPWVE